MKYYRFWIADFESKTNALSNSQRGIYLLLLNHCYMHERGLPADLGTVYLISRATCEADRADVMLVLGTYFQRQDDGSYRNGKCEQLLSEMRQYSDAQKERSALGVAARQSKIKTRAPKTNGVEHPHVSGFVLPDWVPAEAWAGWIEVRKKIRAPNTDQAMRLSVKTLEQLRGKGFDPATVLNQSTQRGWRGLFEVSESNKDKNEREMQALFKRLQDEEDAANARH